MAKECLLEEDEDAVTWFVPDERGFTTRTQYKNTQQVLDENARLRADAPKTYRENGKDFHHVGRIPMEVWEPFCIRLGRMPTAKEVLELLKDRDYSKLKTNNRRL